MLPNIDVLINLYVNENKDLGEICRVYGLSENSRSNLSSMLKKHGVVIRKQSGKDHHGWKGGRIIKGDGYYGIWSPNHERKDYQGYVYEHTLVFEKNTGTLPKKNEVLHHIDLDKLNNDFNNLYLCDSRKHIQCHRSIENLIHPLLDGKIIRFNNGIYEINVDVFAAILSQMKGNT